MFVVSKHLITGKNFKTSVSRAIVAAFKKNGYPPNAVLVLPGTTKLTSITVTVGQDIMIVPISVRNDLATGFNVKPNEFLLDICNPNSTLE